MLRSPSRVVAALCIGLWACGDDESAGTGGSGGTGATSTADVVVASADVASSTGTGTGEVDGTLADVHAPDRTHVTATWSGAAPLAADATAYALSSDHGDLEITSASLDATTKTVTFETASQKLGVTYTLHVAAPGSLFDGKTADFLAADWVDFWATEFDFFNDYVVTARRVAVGDHAVLYLQDGMDAGDVELTKSRFDETIYPIERDLFREPPDRDDNGRIVLLGLDGKDWYGGYFSPTNTLTDAEALSTYGTHSNELEIIYFNVTAMGGYDSEGVVPHEYQHMLYAEEHGAFDTWNWFNEGLAECAVNAVWGDDTRAVQEYASDPSGDIRNGISLVDWQFANYAQYAQAYVFLSYVAGQLGGVSGYGDLFHAQNGDPRELDTLFRAQLGRSFPEVQLDALTAAWLQEPTGPYGFGDVIELPNPPETAMGDERDLPAFAGATFRVVTGGISPQDAGPDVRLRGITGSGAIDDEAPFDVPNGVVIALNGLLDPFTSETESSGTIAASDAPNAIRPGSSSRAAWLHAPPVPARSEAMRRFRERTRGIVSGP